MKTIRRPTSTGSHHYLLALETWFAEHLPQSESQGTGIFHTLIQYPTRKSLATVYLNLKTAAYPLLDAIDLGVSEIIYLEDPDGNSLELCWDRPKKENRSNQKVSLTGLLTP